jgi:hypothetical protein
MRSYLCRSAKCQIDEMAPGQPSLVGGSNVDSDSRRRRGKIIKNKFSVFFYFNFGFLNLDLDF